MITPTGDLVFPYTLYYTLPDLCGTLHCSSPKMAEVASALRHAGYDAGAGETGGGLPAFDSSVSRSDASRKASALREPDERCALVQG